LSVMLNRSLIIGQTRHMHLHSAIFHLYLWFDYYAIGWKHRVLWNCLFLLSVLQILCCLYSLNFYRMLNCELLRIIMAVNPWYIDSVV
jgi:hypothetical protein